MAIIYQPDPEMSNEDREAIALNRSFKDISSTAAWRAIEEYLNGLVSEAHETLVGNFNRPELDTPLANRWRQRVVLKRDLESFVASHVKAHDDYMEELKQNPPEDEDEHDSNANA